MCGYVTCVPDCRGSVLCIISKNEVKKVGLDQISYRYDRMSFDKVTLLPTWR
jgi:hypothetical protein